jgi:hypothetical protein
MAYFGEEMDLDPYEEDEYFLNLGLFGSDPYFSAGRRALSSLPSILAGIYARGRELSSNAGGYEDEDGDGIYEPSGPRMQEQEMGTPVTIVQRNEEGEQIGTIPGIRIGIGENSRVVTLDELASINQARRRAGQSTIVSGTPGFVPELVDESGATISNETSNVRTPSTNTGTRTPPTLPATSTPATSGTSARPTTPTPSIYDLGGGGGGGKVPITLPGGRTILIPEDSNPLQLLTQGIITREIYKYITGEDAPDDTTNVDDTANVDDNTNVDKNGDASSDDTQVDNKKTEMEDLQETDAQKLGLDADYTGTSGPYQFENGRIVGMAESSTDPDPDLDPNLGTDPGLGTDPDPGTDPGTDPGDGTKKDPGDDAGEYTGEGFDYEKFFEGLSKLYPAIPAGASFEEGVVPRILPTALSYEPQVKSFAQLIDRLNREISPKQAETALDLYSDITSGVREAQSPLMKSLARRSDMLGARAEGLMGQLSFLEDRGATQTGYGQAASFGRALDPALREQQAGRLREEQRNVNLQLAGNLLGQQRATAGLMADIESGIYSRMAPDIGVDPGSILGIAGTDIQNILGEQAARQYSEAIREGSRREQQAKFLETGIGLIPKDFITFGGVEKKGGFTIPGTSITVGGTTI